MSRLIYCPFIGCCPIRVAACTSSVASRLIVTHIIPFIRERFAVNVSYSELVDELLQSIDRYCERELENVRRVFKNMGVEVVKACDILPRIRSVVKMNTYSSMVLSLKRIPVLCSDELPNSSAKYKVNYRFSEAAVRTILLFAAIYAIHRVKGIKPIVDGEQVVDIFSKQLSNTWKSKMRQTPIVVDGIELYLDWNKKSFVTQLRNLLLNMASRGI